MLLFTICHLLGTQAPPPPPSLPQASNSVYMKNVEEQFQNQEAPNCDTDEEFVDGSCQKKTQSASNLPPEKNSPH